jgi:hypothetical protein
MAVFLLIGKTSALTMNIAGVVKDWLLIGLSVLLFKSIVTRVNLFGYMIAFAGVCWYNYQKLTQIQVPAQSNGMSKTENGVANGRDEEKAPFIESVDKRERP